jgi:hypothetical protein
LVESKIAGKNCVNPKNDIIKKEPDIILACQNIWVLDINPPSSINMSPIMPNIAAKMSESIPI